VILEVARLQVIRGREQAFEAAFATAQAILAGMRGYVSHELRQCIENPGHYLLLVEWQTLEDHTVGFRQSTQYQEWRGLLHHFYDPFPEVLHYRVVFERST